MFPIGNFRNRDDHIITILSNVIISTLYYSPTMEQFPLREPENGAISLQAFGTSAAISIAPLQHACHTILRSSQWKLLHSWAILWVLIGNKIWRIIDLCNSFNQCNLTSLNDTFFRILSYIYEVGRQHYLSQMTKL